MNRFMALLGPKLGEWKDSVDFCPREVTLRSVVNTLLPLLQPDPDALDHAAIQKALRPIQGENYSSFVRPSTPEMAVGAHQVLQTELASHPTKHDVHWLERYAWNALKQECGESLEDIVDLKTAMEVTPDRPGSLCLVRTQSDRRLIISSSFYIAFAQNQTPAHRFGSVQDFLAAFDFLHASGNVSHAAVSKHRKILCSFLMGVERGDKPGWEDQLLKSRILAVAKGYFRCAPKGTVVVSQQLQIGYGEMLYLREALGKEMTIKMMLAHDLLLNGMQTSSPLEPDWRCPGLPAIGGRDDDVLEFSGGADDDNKAFAAAAARGVSSNRSLDGCACC